MSRAVHPQTEKRKGFTTKVLKAKNKGAQSTQTEKGAPSGPQAHRMLERQGYHREAWDWGFWVAWGSTGHIPVAGWAPRAKGRGSMVEHPWVPTPPPGGWWSGHLQEPPHCFCCHSTPPPRELPHR